MKHVKSLCLLLAVFGMTTAASARDCLEEVRQLHATDLSPEARPKHRTEMHVFAPDGTLVRIFDTIWESPSVVVSGVRDSGLYSLLIGQAFYTGPSPDGPWTKSPAPLQEDRAAQVKRIHAEMTANISEVVCPSTVDLDGTDYLSFSFRTVTETDANGTYFGSLNTVYLDPKTRLVMRWDQTEFVNSWKEGIDPQVQATLFTYDPTIEVPRPD